MYHDFRQFNGLGAEASASGDGGSIPCVEDTYTQIVDGELSVEDEEGRKKVCGTLGACSAAAVCAAYGAASAAPICAEIGKFVGEVVAAVLEEVGEFVGGIFGGSHDTERMKTVRKAHLKATVANLSAAQIAIRQQWEASLGRTHALYETLFGKSMTVEATQALYKKYLALDAMPGTNPVAYNPKYIKTPTCYPEKGCIGSKSSTKGGWSHYIFYKKGEVVGSKGGGTIINPSDTPAQKEYCGTAPYPKYQCPDATFSAYFYAMDNAQLMEIYIRAMRLAEIKIALDGAYAAAAIEAAKQLQEEKDIEKAAKARKRRVEIAKIVAKRRAERRRRKQKQAVLTFGIWGLLVRPK